MGRNDKPEQTVRIGRQISQEEVLAWIKANPQAGVSHTPQGIDVRFDNTLTHYKAGRDKCFPVLVDIAHEQASLGGTAAGVEGAADVLDKTLDVIRGVTQALEGITSGDLRNIQRGVNKAGKTIGKSGTIVGETASCATDVIIPNVPNLRDTEPPGRR